jgi:hypothetical protein
MRWQLSCEVAVPSPFESPPAATVVETSAFSFLATKLQIPTTLGKPDTDPLASPFGASPTGLLPAHNPFTKPSPGHPQNEKLVWPRES